MTNMSSPRLSQAFEIKKRHQIAARLLSEKLEGCHSRFSEPSRPKIPFRPKEGEAGSFAVLFGSHIEEFYGGTDDPDVV